MSPASLEQAKASHSQLRLDLIRRVHPYARVYTGIVLVLAAAITDTPARLLFVGVIVMCAAVAAGVRLRAWLLGILPIISLAVGLFILSLISGMEPGEVKLQATAMFLGHCYLAFLSVSAIFAATQPVDVTQALDVLRIPVLFTAVAGGIFRWFGLLGRESMRMNTARVLRGGDMRGWTNKLNSITKLLSSLMIRSYLRAERVAEAMECRGFHGKIERSVTREFRLADLGAVAVVCIYVAVVWVIAP